MSREAWTRVAVGYLTAMALLVGAWAQFAPQSFYDSFPGLGRAWVSVDGPYNEHLVRDVGGLYLAFAVVGVATFVTLSRTLILAFSAAALATGVPHAIYHATNRAGLGTGDLVANLAGLAVAAAIPVALIVMWRSA